MKKNIITVIFTIITTLFAFTCCAALPDEAFSAEKLTVGAPFSIATELYGSPISERPANTKAKFYVFKTPNGKITIMCESGSNVIDRIDIDEPGCKTAANIGVGSLITEIKNAYGTPNVETDFVYPKEHVLIYRLPVNGNLVKKLQFGTVGGKVTSIIIAKVFET